MAEIVIWGSGAIGGTIGAHLARTGRKVLFVYDPDLVNLLVPSFVSGSSDSSSASSPDATAATTKTTKTTRTKGAAQ